MAPFVLEDEEADRELAVDPEEPFDAAGAVAHPGDVGQGHRPVGHDAHLAEGVEAARPAVDDDGGASGFVFEAADEAQAGHRAIQGVEHLLGGDADRGAAVGIDLHRHLAAGAARRRAPG